eukprot:Platyproteum_vivax@DN728_c0_g1_i1.p1
MSSVYLRVYDISDGKAAIWSPVVLWKKIEGVWHTGVHVYGYEYFYGGGILKMHPEDVEQGYKMKPKEVLHLGYTNMTQSDFEMFLDQIKSEFKRETYDLIKWNCNHFSDVCSNFLLDRGIPEHIVGLPDEISSTVMGNMIIKAMKAVRGQPPIDSTDAAVAIRSERVASASRSRRGSVSSVNSLQLPRHDKRRNSCPVALPTRNHTVVTQATKVAPPRLPRAPSPTGGAGGRTRCRHASLAATNAPVAGVVANRR